MNIVEVIKKDTLHCRDKTAVLEGSHDMSYEELLSFADKTGSELKKYGVKDGARIALFCDDCIEYIVASLGILSINAVVVPISPTFSGDEVENILERMDIDFLIREGAEYEKGELDKIFEFNAFKKEFYIHGRKTKGSAAYDHKKLNPAFLRFSSGTTGESKGVLLSHEAIISRTDAANEGLEITGSDTVIWTLSMSFHFVVTILLFLRKGATIVLCGGEFHNSLLNGLNNNRGTFIYASPFLYHYMVDSMDFDKEMLSDIRMAVSTAMKLPVEVAESFKKKFGIELCEAYGIIEVGLPFVNRPGAAAKPGSLGKVLPAYEIKIANEDKNGAGEIFLRGAGMFDAYLSPWQTREELFPDGWFNTGDTGRLVDGELFIEGREKNVINFAGMKVFPFEVESVLNKHPAVNESKVYGMSHPRFGQIPEAEVVLKESGAEVDNDGLRKFCYQYLAPYKVPKEFHKVSALVKTASGKLKR